MQPQGAVPCLKRFKVPSLKLQEGRCFSGCYSVCCSLWGATRVHRIQVPNFYRRWERSPGLWSQPKEWFQRLSCQCAEGVRKPGNPEAGLPARLGESSVAKVAAKA